jgi:hypothetical protein
MSPRSPRSSTPPALEAKSASGTRAYSETSNPGAADEVHYDASGGGGPCICARTCCANPGRETRTRSKLLEGQEANYSVVDSHPVFNQFILSEQIAHNDSHQEQVKKGLA